MTSHDGPDFRFVAGAYVEIHDEHGEVIESWTAGVRGSRIRMVRLLAAWIATSPKLTFEARRAAFDSCGFNQYERNRSCELADEIRAEIDAGRYPDALSDFERAVARSSRKKPPGEWKIREG